MISNDVTHLINHDPGSTPRSDPADPTIKFVPTPLAVEHQFQGFEKVFKEFLTMQSA